MNPDDSNDLVESRGELYGEFSSNAAITQLCEQTFNELANHYDDAPFIHKEALHMIIQKLSRCFCGGSFYYQDTWDDIAGYAKCVSEYIEDSKESK